MPAVTTRGRGRRAMNEINMVPFIDVMLVLLIIFMVTATVITPGNINIPSAGQAQRPPDQRVDLLIDAQGRISLGGALVQPGISEEQAVQAISQALQTQPDLPVMIAADSQLQYEQVIRVMSQLQEQARVQRIGLAVK